MILHETTGCRVLLHADLRHDATIVAFQPRNPRLDPTKPGAFGAPFLKDSLTLSDFPANFVSILVNRNSWYLDDEALQAVGVIRARLKPGRVIAYGSSMGGFAAINLSTALGADYFVALSPLSTIFPPFASAIRDCRYQKDAAQLSDRNDFIGRGDVGGQTGLIFFDPMLATDAAHAARLATLTQANLVAVPGGGHPCGPALNEMLPLRRILAEVARGEPDVAAFRKVLLAQHADNAAATALRARVQAFLARAEEALATLPAAGLRDLVVDLRGAAAAGLSGAELQECLTELANLAIDPAVRWPERGGMRETTLTRLCLELRRLGARDQARRLAQDHLPPEKARIFTSSRPDGGLPRS